jgi:hypothetical protein
MKNEKEILALNDPWQSYCYCFNNKETANIKAHEKVILNSKDPHYCYLFARDIYNANIKGHEKIILDSRNTYYCYLFARDIFNSNKDSLFKTILESKDLDYIKHFYDNIDFDKAKYNNLLLFI